MKIPETSANIGAYYGNEENGQWQPNGVMIDGGVGGGVVGSGDAGVRPQMYPVHVRPHIPAGYVVAGYYPGGVAGGEGAGAAAGAPHDDFADYMWMEHEEEFDKQVMQQLEEEALMEQCIEAMLEDEQRELRQERPHNGHHRQCPVPSNGGPTPPVSLEEAVSRSTLNPLAAEFVPTRRPHALPQARTQPHTQPHHTESAEEISSETSLERAESDAALRLSAGDPGAALHRPAAHRHTVAEARPPSPPPPAAVPVPAATEPQPALTPVVSAAQHTQDTHNNKKETKPQKSPVPKSEAKRKPMAGTKSETKLPAAKTEVKKEKEDSEERREEKDEVDSVKVEPAAPVTSEESTGRKPINYAAAARATKPKSNAQTNDKTPAKPVTEKPSITKVVEKTSSTKLADKSTPKSADKVPTKSDVKSDKKAKPAQRKNSAK